VLHRDRIALVQVTAQLEILVDRVAEVALPHLTEPFGQVVDDQAVLVGEKLRPHLRDFPAGNIGMKSVEERRVDHDVWKRRKQVARLDQGVDRLVDVADEDH
jgi:hypothetical protein